MSEELTQKLMSEGLVKLQVALERANIEVSPRSAARWARQGVQRDGKPHRLEAIQIGKVLFTTMPALYRFMSIPDPGKAPPVRTPCQRRKATEEADAELQRMGL